jgi:hypothetical protein
MANGSSTVRRTLQFKFTLPSADGAQLLPMMNVARPFIQAFGGTRIRLLQNVDDPARFVQEIEYETHESIELNRHRIASDPRVQAYLQGWRSLLGGAVEIDVYQDVA